VKELLPLGSKMFSRCLRGVRVASGVKYAKYCVAELGV
jgi:hypothetical protein